MARDKAVLLKDVKVEKIVMDGVESIVVRFDPETRKWWVTVEKMTSPPPDIKFEREDVYVDTVEVKASDEVALESYDEKARGEINLELEGLCVLTEVERHGKKTKGLVCAPKIEQKGKDVRELLR